GWPPCPGRVDAATQQRADCAGLHGRRQDRTDHPGARRHLRDWISWRLRHGFRTRRTNRVDQRPRIDRTLRLGTRPPVTASMLPCTGDPTGRAGSAGRLHRPRHPRAGSGASADDAYQAGLTGSRPRRYHHVQSLDRICTRSSGLDASRLERAVMGCVRGGSTLGLHILLGAAFLLAVAAPCRAEVAVFNCSGQMRVVKQYKDSDLGDRDAFPFTEQLIIDFGAGTATIGGVIFPNVTVTDDRVEGQFGTFELGEKSDLFSL